MSTRRCGWICPRSDFFAVVFLAGASFAVLLAGVPLPRFMCGMTGWRRQRGGLPCERGEIMGVHPIGSEEDAVLAAEAQSLYERLGGVYAIRSAVRLVYAELP
jgi:hypothetical protein